MLTLSSPQFQKKVNATVIPEDFRARFGEFDDDLASLDQAISDAEVRLLT